MTIEKEKPKRKAKVKRRASAKKEQVMEKQVPTAAELNQMNQVETIELQGILQGILLPDPTPLIPEEVEEEIPEEAAGDDHPLWTAEVETRIENLVANGFRKMEDKLLVMVARRVDDVLTELQNRGALAVDPTALNNVRNPNVTPSAKSYEEALKVLGIGTDDVASSKEYPDKWVVITKSTNKKFSAKRV